MRFTFFMFFVSTVILASPFAHAKVCYQGRTTVFNSAARKATAVTLTLDWNGGRGDWVNRVRVDGMGIHLTSTLFCGDPIHSQIECGLEEDGGRAVIQVSHDVAAFSPIGRVQVEADDTGRLDHLEIVPTASPQLPIVLRAISAPECARLFPHSDRIIVPPPPKY